MTLKHLWCHQYHISGLEMRREKRWRASKMYKSINSTLFTPCTQNKWSWKKAWPASYISAGACKMASDQLERWNNFAAGDVCLQLISLVSNNLSSYLAPAVAPTVNSINFTPRAQIKLEHRVKRRKDGQSLIFQQHQPCSPTTCRATWLQRWLQVSIQLYSLLVPK